MDDKGRNVSIDAIACGLAAHENCICVQCRGFVSFRRSSGALVESVPGSTARLLHMYSAIYEIKFRHVHETLPYHSVAVRGDTMKRSIEEKLQTMEITYNFLTLIPASIFWRSKSV